MYLFSVMRVDLTQGGGVGSAGIAPGDVRLICGPRVARFWGGIVV